MILIGVERSYILTGQAVFFTKQRNPAFTQAIQAAATSHPKISLEVVRDRLHEVITNGDNFPSLVVTTSQPALSTNPKQAAAILSDGGNILGNQISRFDHGLKLAFAQFKEAGAPRRSPPPPTYVLPNNHYHPPIFLPVPRYLSM